jgi:hypothetical protein
LLVEKTARYKKLPIDCLVDNVRNLVWFILPLLVLVVILGLTVTTDGRDVSDSRVDASLNATIAVDTSFYLGHRRVVDDVDITNR